jgi:hexosaminidase
MSWRGEKGGIEAAKMKHKVIMTPQNPLYFDHTQSANEDSVTIGGFNPLEKVYAYDPVPGSLSKEEAKYIMGAQANVWAEYIKNTSKVEYTIFPRMAALAEVLWTPKEKRNWAHFEQRLPDIFKTYQQWGANFSTAYYELTANVIPSTDSTSSVMWKLSTRDKDARIVWQKTLTMDDPPNPPPFNEYMGPVEIVKSGEYRGWTFVEGKPTAPIRQVFHINSATGKPVTLARPASPTYPGDGPFTLVNGVINEKALDRSREFLGFSGTNCEATIDLGSLQPVSFVVVNCLQQRASWIWPPRAAEVYGSADGKEFYPLGSTTIFNESGKRKGTMIMAFRSTHARYIKVIVKNQGIIPEGNPGAGKAAWLFIDEIEVDGPKE